MPHPTHVPPAFATPLTIPLRPFPHPPASFRPRPTQTPPSHFRRTPPAAKMVRVSVPLSVEAPPDYCHRLFSDLSLMPAWSSTLESVTRDSEDPTFSEWVFSWNGIRLSWRARDEDDEDEEDDDEDDPPPGEELAADYNNRAIRWRSVSGLNHIGAVQFFPEDKGDTNMVMTVDYDIASLLAVVMESGLVTTFVESAIQSDMQRFRAYTLRSLRKERIAQKKPS